MSKPGMLAIDPDGDRAIEDYLKSVAEWLEYSRTPAEDRAAVVESLREQIHDSLMAGGDGGMMAVARVLEEEMPSPKTFAGAGIASGAQPAARSPRERVEGVGKQLTTPSPWATVYMFSVQLFLSTVVLVLMGAKYSQMIEVFAQLGGTMPPLARALAPSVMFAWRFPVLTFMVLAIAYAPVYVLYYQLRRRTWLAVGIPIALALAMLVYLAALGFGLSLCLFAIPKLTGG